MTETDGKTLAVGAAILLNENAAEWTRGLTFYVKEMKHWGVICCNVSERGEAPYRAAWSEIASRAVVCEPAAPAEDVDPYAPSMVRKILALPGGAVIIACALVTSPLRTDHELAGKCKICDAAVQASPKGRAAIAAGGTVLCVRCGLVIAEYKADQGKLSGVVIGPSAEASLPKADPNQRDQIDLLRTAFPFDPSTSNYPD